MLDIIVSAVSSVIKACKVFVTLSTNMAAGTEQADVVQQVCQRVTMSIMIRITSVLLLLTRH